MNFISILLIAIGLSMDAFAVALTIGMNVKRENKLSIAIKAALFFGVFQGLMPLLGWLLGISFSSYIEKVDHWIAFALLIIIGGKMIIEAINKKEEDEKVKEYSNKDFTILAIATSIDALAIGVTFAFLNVNIITSVSIIAITTFILCVVSVYLGEILGKILKSKAEVIGGIILIVMGIKILIEHLFS